MLTVDFKKLIVNPGDRVLDAGCGFGRHSLECLMKGADVFSMDLDLESLRKTRFSLFQIRNEYKKMNPFLVHSGDALKLPYKDASFDAIICSEVMEHVSDDSLACQELVRVLKKNGKIAITVPTYFSEVLYDMLSYEYFSTPGGHIRKYLPKKLCRIMSNSGLEIYAIGHKHSFHTIWWIIRCVVGLHRDKHPITRGYHIFLKKMLFSPIMRRVESFFDYFFPKSLVVYAWKR